MTDNRELFDALHEIVGSIDPTQNNADWGREFGQAVYETGDEELIVYVLSDAGEKYRSHELSKRRRTARKAAYRIASSSNGERMEAVARQLEMPIVVPGFPPLPLSSTWHLFLVDACASAKRHIDGALQNLRLWERARDVSAPWPEEPIGNLIADGKITPDALAFDSESKSA